jgi:hypothetical protein
MSRRLDQLPPPWDAPIPPKPPRATEPWLDEPYEDQLLLDPDPPWLLLLLLLEQYDEFSPLASGWQFRFSSYA